MSVRHHLKLVIQMSLHRSSFSFTTCSHHSQLSSAIFHIVDTTVGRIKVREVKKNDRESGIQQAIEEREKKRTSLHDLAILFEIPRSTLNDRLRSIPSRYEAQKKHQAISPAAKRSLIRWVDEMDASGFQPRLDLSKAAAARLLSGPPLGSTWLRGFLNHHPEPLSRFVSGLDRQRALSSKPEPIKDYFQRLRMLPRGHNSIHNNI